MAIAWSRSSSKVIALPPYSDKACSSRWGMGKTVRAHLYRTRLTKNSRKSWKRMTPRERLSQTRGGMYHGRLGRLQPPKIHTASRSAPCPPKRFVKKRAQARPRHRLTVQERLARDRRQAPIHPLVVIWVTPLWCLQKRS